MASRGWQRVRAAAAGAAVAVLLASAVGCRAQAGGSALRIAHESDLLTLDPHASLDSATQSVLGNACEGLVTWDKDMRLRPALAITWSTVDENTWVVQLRPDVRFHDGHVLGSRDVKYSLDRARGDAASVLKGHLATVDAVDQVDAGAVRIRTRTPEPLLMTRLTYVCIVGAPAGAYDPERLVGTGPYRITRWAKDEHAVEAEAFDGYWGGKPAVGRVRFVAAPGEKVLDPLRDGQVDVLRWVPETMLAAARALPGTRVEARSGLSTYYLWLNSTPAASGAAKNPLSDRRVRQALAMAVDRRALVQGLGGNGTPAFQLVPPAIFGYVADLEPLRYDPDGARRLLAAAGHPTGLSVSLVHRPQAPLPAVAQMLRDQFAVVGVRLLPDPHPWPEIVAGWRKASLPALLAAWRFEDGDASGFLHDCLFTRDDEHHHGAMNPGYSNPALDRLIEENTRTFDDVRRLRQYEQLMRIALDDVPIVPLYHRYNLYGVSERVRWQPRLDGRLLAAEMSLK
jgi:peptide/nickel transport system substrate-binding protein